MTIHTKVLLADSAAVENGPTVRSNVAPFSVGMTALAIINMNGFSGTVKIQSSEDQTTWTDEIVKSGSTSDQSIHAAVKLGSYVRGMTTARTAGSVSVMLQG